MQAQSYSGLMHAVTGPVHSCVQCPVISSTWFCCRCSPLSFTVFLLNSVMVSTAVLKHCDQQSTTWGGGHFSNNSQATIHSLGKSEQQVKAVTWNRNHRWTLHQWVDLANQVIIVTCGFYSWLSIPIIFLLCTINRTFCRCKVTGSEEAFWLVSAWISLHPVTQIPGGFLSNRFFPSWRVN